MKNTWFYLSRILATVVMIALFSLIGIGNPVMIPAYAGFFILVFALIYFANRQANKNRDGAGTGGTGRLIMQIVATALFIGVLSLVGLINSPLWIAIWAVVLVVIFLIVFLVIHKRQRHSEIMAANPLTRKVIGVVLALLALLLPFWIVWKGSFIMQPEGKAAMFILATLVGLLVFAVLMLFAVALINRQGRELMYRILGYLIIIVASILPGILVTLVDKASTAVAGAYFAALVALIISFYAKNLIVGSDSH